MKNKSNLNEPQKKQRFSLRKYSNGVASVALGALLVFGSAGDVEAAEYQPNPDLGFADQELVEEGAVEDESQFDEDDVVGVGNVEDRVEEIPYDTTYSGDETVAFQEQEVRVEGVNGSETTTYEYDVDAEYGSLSNPTQVGEAVVVDPTNEEVAVGNVKEETVVTEEHDTTYAANPELDFAEERVEVEGENATETTRTAYDVNAETGELEGEGVETTTTSPAVTEEVGVGNVNVADVVVERDTVYGENPELDFEAREVVEEGEDGVERVTTTFEVDPEEGHLENPTSTTEQLKAPANRVVNVGNARQEATVDPFETTYLENDELAFAESVVVREGQDGLEVVTHFYTVDPETGEFVTDENGEYVVRVEDVTDEDDVEEVDALIAIGTVKEVVESIQYETIELFDDSIAAGVREIQQAGRVGQDRVVYDYVIDENGQLVDPTETSRETLVDKIDQIVMVGTAVPLTPLEPSQPVEDEEDENNEETPGDDNDKHIIPAIPLEPALPVENDETSGEEDETPGQEDETPGNNDETPGNNDENNETPDDEEGETGVLQDHIKRLEERIAALEGEENTEVEVGALKLALGLLEGLAENPSGEIDVTDGSLDDFLDYIQEQQDQNEGNDQEPGENDENNETPGNDDETPGQEDETPGNENETPGEENETPDDDETVLTEGQAAALQGHIERLGERIAALEAAGGSESEINAMKSILNLLEDFAENPTTDTIEISDGSLDDFLDYVKELQEQDKNDDQNPGGDQTPGDDENDDDEKPGQDNDESEDAKALNALIERLEGLVKELEDDNSESNEELEDLKAQLAALKEEAEDAEGSYEDLKEQAKELEEKAEKLEDKLKGEKPGKDEDKHDENKDKDKDRLKAKAERLEKELEELEKDNKFSDKKLAKLRKELADAKKELKGSDKEVDDLLKELDRLEKRAEKLSDKSDDDKKGHKDHDHKGHDHKDHDHKDYDKKPSTDEDSEKPRLDVVVDKEDDVKPVVKPVVHENDVKVVDTDDDVVALPETGASSAASLGLGLGAILSGLGLAVKSKKDEE